MKYNFDNLMFEITRKCNMACCHCLRGPAQNKTMSKEVMLKTLRKVNYIHCVTFGGGEPTLSLDMIWYFIDCCKMLDVEVGNFYIVTNGKRYHRELEDVCDALYQLCTDNEISGLTVSDDEFHREFQPNRSLFLKTRARYMYGEDMYYNEIAKYGDFEEIAKPYARFHDKEHNDYQFYGIINMGRAKENGLGQRKLIGDTVSVCCNDYNSDFINVSDANIYITVDGDIINTCDCSYKEMKNYKIGDIDHFDDTFLKFLVPSDTSQCVA